MSQRLLRYGCTGVGLIFVFEIILSGMSWIAVIHVLEVLEICYSILIILVRPRFGLVSLYIVLEVFRR